MMNIFKLLCFVTTALRMTYMECCEYPKLLFLDYFFYYIFLHSSITFLQLHYYEVLMQ